MLVTPPLLFISYAHADEEHRQQLEKHLSLLERLHLVALWSDREIAAGDEWKGRIDDRLMAADIILLLVSPDFIASDYLWDEELKRAMERHTLREARVVPIIVRDVAWRDAPFGRLAPLPTNGKPVASKTWYSVDEAWTNVADGLRRIVEPLAQKGGAKSQMTRPPRVVLIGHNDDAMWMRITARRVSSAAERPGTEVSILEFGQATIDASTQDELSKALVGATAIILFVSANFLTWIRYAGYGLPGSLVDAQRQGTNVQVLVVDHCILPPALAYFRTVNERGRPLCVLGPDQRRELIARLTKIVAAPCVKEDEGR